MNNNIYTITIVIVIQGKIVTGCVKLLINSDRAGNERKNEKKRLMEKLF